jgi:hypothetical protein
MNELVYKPFSKLMVNPPKEPKSSLSKIPVNAQPAKVDNGFDIEEHNKLATPEGMEKVLQSYLKP